MHSLSKLAAFQLNLEAMAPNDMMQRKQRRSQGTQYESECVIIKADMNCDCL